MTGISEIELKCVLAMLNSRLMTYYVRQSFVTNQQAFPQIVMSNLMQLPIATLSSDQQKKLVILVDRILTAKRRNASADTRALEREIDQQVYALYGLTPEEIKIVEATSK